MGDAQRPAMESNAPEYDPQGVALPDPAPKPQAPDERELVRRRRLQAGLSSPEQLAAPVQALALSGGGIRSATFCFGLVRALAKNGVLRNFDYLSTVSGGGYVGSAVSRLYGQDQDAKTVQEGLARDDSVLLWWLRSNGRYLTPAGLRDLGQAFASIFRGVLSTHFEVGVLLFVAAAMLVLPYVVLPSLAGTGAWPAWLGSFRDGGGSFWWWAMAVPAFAAFHHIFAYWFWRAGFSWGSTLVDLAFAVASAAIAWNWRGDALAPMRSGPPTPIVFLSALACLLLLSPLTAGLSRLARSGSSLPKARLMHTKGLARAAWGALVLALLGALDLGSWWLSGRIDAVSTSAAVTVPSAAAFIAAVRLLLTRVDGLKKWIKARSASLGWARLLNLAGIACLLLLVVVWVTAFQWFADPRHEWQWLKGMLDARAWLPLSPRTGQWLVLLAVPFLYMALTSRNLELLNLSSLHNFYRARIERAYVSTGNRNRFPAGVLASRQDVDTTIPQMRLAQSVEGDDIDLGAHRPHLHGGPIHLVNCCINQTVDDRTGSYNADRKGVFLTVSALGAETGTRKPDGLAVTGKLSMWAAVSGAAASSGMGSQTSPGLAALLFLSGLRLGYWQRALGDRKDEDARTVLRPELVMDEALARFPGLQSAQWYLSDGGHFDNTGVYSLLKRKVSLIVLADCGADPGYQFEDLENLVRKAEIDYGAGIEFLPPPALADGGSGAEERLRAFIGTPADFKPGEGEQCLLLGRIRYGDGSCGTLIVVKPRLVPGLPLDIVAYGRRNAVFPQQHTGDQFFDEAQWESYHQLGLHLGLLLTAEHVAALEHWATADAYRPGPGASHSRGA